MERVGLKRVGLSWLVLLAVTVATVSDSLSDLPFEQAMTKNVHELSVLVRNPSYTDVTLYWVSPEKKEVVMNTIPKLGSTKLTSFDGHTFGWRTAGTSDPLYLFTVKSEMDGTKYTLPGMTIGGLSFINLAARRLAFYWKGNGELQFQGHLDGGEQLGLESYEGHNFIWAEPHGTGPTANPTVVGEITIQAGKMIYAYIDETTPPKMLDQLNVELKFRAQYLESHGYPYVQSNKRHILSKNSLNPHMLKPGQSPEPPESSESCSTPSV